MPWEVGGHRTGIDIGGGSSVRPLMDECTCPFVQGGRGARDEICPSKWMDGWIDGCTVTPLRNVLVAL